MNKPKIRRHEDRWLVIGWTYPDTRIWSARERDAYLEASRWCAKQNFLEHCDRIFGERHNTWREIFTSTPPPKE